MTKEFKALFSGLTFHVTEVSLANGMFLYTMQYRSSGCDETLAIYFFQLRIMLGVALYRVILI